MKNTPLLGNSLFTEVENIILDLDYIKDLVLAIAAVSETKNQLIATHVDIKVSH